MVEVDTIKTIKQIGFFFFFKHDWIEIYFIVWTDIGKFSNDGIISNLGIIDE